MVAADHRRQRRTVAPHQAFHHLVMFRHGGGPFIGALMADEADALHLIRKGSVSVSKRLDGRSVVLNYVASGNYVGEMGLISDAPRSASVTAAIASETIRIDGSAFKTLMASNPKLKATVEEKFSDRIAQNEKVSQSGETGGILQFLLEQGVSEATDVLLIDEALCVGCDNCEKACAETHDGISRLDREAGPTYGLTI